MVVVSSSNSSDYEQELNTQLIKGIQQAVTAAVRRTSPKGDRLAAKYTVKMMVPIKLVHLLHYTKRLAGLAYISVQNHFRPFSSFLRALILFNPRFLPKKVTFFFRFFVRFFFWGEGLFFQVFLNFLRRKMPAA